MTAPIHTASNYPVPVSSPASAARRRSPRRDGFTVIELLVAMVITLIMMGAVATLFGTITGGVQDARATIEMTERLRSATSRLQQDLQGATATMLPPLKPEADPGYFEIIEGPLNDWHVGDSTTQYNLSTVPLPNQNFTRFGDTDDVLMFTTRTRGEPFIGKGPPALKDANGVSFFPNGTAQSQIVEVVFFLRPSPTSTAINPQFTLYRRAMLVLPNIGTFSANGANVADTPANFRDNYDLSVRRTSNVYVANTLGDLTKRENRFAHNLANGGLQFPHAVNFAIDNNYPAPAIQEYPSGTVRYGEDVILSNVLSFDVQVWDPGCPLVSDPSGITLSPRDPGFNGTLPLAGYGAFVDLAYGDTNYGYGSTLSYSGTATNPASFAGGPAARSKLDYLSSAVNFYNPRRATYDTYSTHYENNWVDTNTNGTPDAGEPGVEVPGRVDQSTNGFDDNNDGVVDDPDEMETAPPYAAPLRGIRITIRVYEPDSRQVREVNIEQDFVPE